jgi:hypothetical protein
MLRGSWLNHVCVGLTRPFVDSRLSSPTRGVTQTVVRSGAQVLSHDATSSALLYKRLFCDINHGRFSL